MVPHGATCARSQPPCSLQRKDKDFMKIGGLAGNRGTFWGRCLTLLRQRSLSARRPARDPKMCPDFPTRLGLENSGILPYMSQEHRSNASPRPPASSETLGFPIPSDTGNFRSPTPSRVAGAPILLNGGLLRQMRCVVSEPFTVNFT